MWLNGWGREQRRLQGEVARKKIIIKVSMTPSVTKKPLTFEDCMESWRIVQVTCFLRRRAYCTFRPFLKA